MNIEIIKEQAQLVVLAPVIAIAIISIFGAILCWLKKD